MNELDEIAYTQQWYDSLHSQLGEGVCRQLGIYAIPEGFQKADKLSMQEFRTR